jgi:hypothetical protein
VRVYDDVAIVLSRERSDIQLNGRQVGGEMQMTRVYEKFGTPVARDCDSRQLRPAMNASMG